MCFSHVLHNSFLSLGVENDDEQRLQSFVSCCRLFAESDFEVPDALRFFWVCLLVRFDIWLAMTAPVAPMIIPMNTSVVNMMKSHKEDSQMKYYD